jgi:hypothetical protein
VLHNNAGGSTAQDDTAVNAPLDEFWRAIKLGRRDLDLPAAMREGPQCRLEARPANSVEDDLRAPTFGQTVDRRIARLFLEKDEVIGGASRGRPGGKLIPVDPITRAPRHFPICAAAPPTPAPVTSSVSPRASAAYSTTPNQAAR